MKRAALRAPKIVRETKAASVAVRMVTALLLCVGAALVHAANADQDSASRLRAQYTELRTQLSNNQFQKPLYLSSKESSDSLAGDVYALVDHPFVTAAAALSGAGDWCKILLLPFNTKSCRVSTAEQGTVLSVRIGGKHDQPVDQAYPVQFLHRISAQTSEYLQVGLDAEQGPLGHALLPCDRSVPRRVVGAAAGAVRKTPARLVRGDGALPAPATRDGAGRLPGHEAQGTPAAG